MVEYGHRYLISLGAGEEQRYSLEKANNMGIKTLAFDMNADAPCKDIASVFYNIDIKDKEEILDIASGYNVAGILPAPIGRYITTAGYLNDALSLKGASFKAADICSDKDNLREFLKNNGFPYPRKFEISDKPAITFPVIVKPRFGSGSKFVKIIRNLEELNDYNEAYSRAATNYYGSLMIEEYIEGIEYGIDAMAQNGELTFLNIREKFVTPMPYRQELGYIMPADIPDEKKTAVENVIGSFIEKTCIKDAVIHADIIAGNNGNIYIIDISPRPAGLNIAGKLIPYCLGFDIIAYWINYMISDEPLPDINIERYVLQQYFPFENVEIKDIPDINDLKNKFDIHYMDCRLTKYYLLGSIQDCTDIARRGFYIIGSDNKADLLKRNEDILSIFRIKAGIGKENRMVIL